MSLELHPYNHRFEWTPVRGPFRRITQAQADAFNQRGFFVLEDALDSEMVARAIEAIRPWEARVEASLLATPGRRRFIAEAEGISFTVHLVKRSQVLRELSAAQVFADLCHDLIGPNVRLYWDQAVYKRPEKPKPFPWHQDNGYTYVEPQDYLTCWVALTDATEENGCPRVVPGIHRMGTLKHWLTGLGFQCLQDPPDAVTVPVRAGSIVVFSSL